jgi:uncharacterized protein (DUF697 family)
MSVKKLPKAIRSTIHDMRGTAAARDSWGSQATPGRVSGSNEQPERTDPAAQSARAGAATEVGGPTSGRGGKIALVPAARANGKSNAAGRRWRARSIVERHSAYAAVGGIIPLPVANVASITAVIVRMVKVLSDLYGVPFQRDRARAIVVGLMGGAMPTGLATVTSSTLVYVIPGSNLIGLAVSSLAGAACTRSIGRIFVEHFESGATLNDFPAAEGR